MNTVVVLLCVGVCIVAVLSYFAIKLTLRVRSQELKLKAQAGRHEQQQLEKINYIVESLQVISRAALNSEVDYSEATLRCKMLLDGLGLNDKAIEPYLILDEVYHQIKVFDTHQARKDLTKEERRRQDKERLSIERRYRTQLKKCFEQLQSFQLPLSS